MGAFATTRTSVPIISGRGKVSKANQSAKENLGFRNVPTGRQKRSPVLIIPGYRGWTGLYRDIATSLRDSGHCEVVTVQVSTHEWLLSLFAGRSFAWYLRRVYTALETLHREHGPVSLVAHSQGGVLALICIGPQTYDGITFNATSMAGSLVTLGTGFKSAEAFPFRDILGLQEHRSNEEPLPADVAREEAQRINTRSLAFASYYYPDANCLPSTRTVCVARFCEANSQSCSAAHKDTAEHGPLRHLRHWFHDLYSAISYRVSLDSNVEGVVGDGVTPASLALWPGCSETLVLKEVRHIFPFYGLQWYGSADVVNLWDSYQD